MFHGLSHLPLVLLLSLLLPPLLLPEAVFLVLTSGLGLKGLFLGGGGASRVPGSSSTSRGRFLSLVSSFYVTDDMCLFKRNIYLDAGS